MKTIFKGFFKLLFSLVSLLLVLLLVAGTWFGVQGYYMYQDVVRQAPMGEMVQCIRSMDGFTQFDELPEIYVQAVVSAEDKHFWDHHGVDYLSICRAVWNDLQTFSFAQGGSTITQQLMKNEYFTQEKTLERKFAEVFAAWDLEREYGKEEIFELYVNTIYFGSGYYGIREAAQGYFSKAPSELSDYEAIMLAGLPNAPSAYSPDSSPELAKQRMKQVLDQMVECSVLSQRKADRIFEEK